MSGHAQLTYRDLDKAYAFTRGSHDEDGVVSAVDHPEFYCCLKADGIHRAALPPIVDRGTVSFRDAEDEMIARIDGDVETEESIEADGCDDLFRMDEDDEADQEYEAAWLDDVERAAEDFARGNAGKRLETVTADSVVVIVRRAAAEPKQPVVDDIDYLPPVLSGRRAVLAGPKTILKETGPDRHDWKSNTKREAQYLRHARHG